MKHPIYDLIIGNITGAADPQLFSQLPPSVQPKDPDSSASTDTEVECWVLLLLLPVLLLFQLLNSHNRRQPDLNLREPSDLATVRPKLKLLPRSVKGPVNAVVHTEINASIYKTGKHRESSLVIENKRTLSQTSRSQKRAKN